MAQGRCLGFDDSYVHELWNTSPHTRVTLSWRVGHPEGPAKPTLEASKAAPPALATGPWRAAESDRGSGEAQAGRAGGSRGLALGRETREGRHVREARAEARHLAATMRSVGSTLLAM